MTGDELENFGIFQEALDDVSYLDASRKWELHQFVEYFIQEHFAAVIISDKEKRDPKVGRFLAQRTARSGWTILNFENYIMMTPGKMAFEDGNRSRLLTTLEEVYKEDLPTKDWNHLRLEASDEGTLNKAWLVAMQLGLNVGEAPSDAAIYCFNNLQKLKDFVSKEGRTPQLPG